MFSNGRGHDQHILNLAEIDDAVGRGANVTAAFTGILDALLDLGLNLLHRSIGQGMDQVDVALQADAVAPFLLGKL